MIIQPEETLMQFQEAEKVLHAANEMLESVAQLSHTLAEEGQSMDAARLRMLVQKRGQILGKLAEFRPVIQKALKIAGNGSSEFQYLCQLTTNIQKSDDILIGALQKRKASVARSIQTVQNEKKLQHYIR